MNSEHELGGGMKEKIDFINSFKFAAKSISIPMQIGNINFSLITENESIVDFIQHRYHQFLTNKKNTKYQIEIFISPGLKFSSPDENEVFFNRQEFNDNIYSIYSNGYTGYLDKKSSRGKMIISDDNALTWVEHFLRFAFSWIALDHNSLLFHGAAVVNQNTGYVFFGPSNAGKTTVTEFSSGYTILGDDMVLLQKEEDSVRVFATPFNINMDPIKLTNSHERIKGFYRLRQDEKNFLEKMPITKSLAELMSSVPLSSVNFQGSLTAFDLCKQITETVPCYDLHFTRDNSFWRIINGIA